MKTLVGLARDLEAGATTSRRLVEDCLARIADPRGEGPRTFLKVHAEPARAAAEYYDRLRAHGMTLTPWAGIPVSIKDLFDMAGDVTTAGSTLLRGQLPAREDCPAVARLRAAGFIPIGRTNMTEFAYSGLGLNPHYGTPLSPFERERGRAPGGSSSGAAVSITEEMAYGALGTDTGGSCRIPAAFCGTVGFKPTAHRVPVCGVFPLSRTLDSVGPLAASVRCCAALDAVLAGEPPATLQSVGLRGRRFAVPTHYVLNALEPHVARSFERAISALRSAGSELPRSLWRSSTSCRGSITMAASPARKRTRCIASVSVPRRRRFDRRVAMRILIGREQSARTTWISSVRARTCSVGSTVSSRNRKRFCCRRRRSLLR